MIEDIFECRSSVNAGVIRIIEKENYQSKKNCEKESVISVLRNDPEPSVEVKKKIKKLFKSKRKTMAEISQILDLDLARVYQALFKFYAEPIDDKEENELRCSILKKKMCLFFNSIYCGRLRGISISFREMERLERFRTASIAKIGEIGYSAFFDFMRRERLKNSVLNIAELEKWLGIEPGETLVRGSLVFSRGDWRLCFVSCHIRKDFYFSEEKDARRFQEYASRRIDEIGYGEFIRNAIDMTVDLNKNDQVAVVEKWLGIED